MTVRRYPNLVTATRRSIKAMPWLVDSDKAAADLAVTYATAIQAAGDEVAATAAVAAEARARFGDDAEADPDLLEVVVAAQRQAASAAAQHAKMIGWHGPHLLNTLRALGGAPAERRELDKKATAKSRLAEMRARRSGG